MSRTFVDSPAIREKTPLLLGLIGPSGTGKTMSALRLGTGIQRVTGGDIFVIDTEARRSLHYAPSPGTTAKPPETFKFTHVPFGAPFSPLDYLEAIEHCAKKGAKIIIVDSMSHEHESVGGVLEEHASETKRLAKLWGVSESKAQMSAWSEPKKKRRRLINAVLQMDCNFIFCWRAKEKLKIKPGKDPEALGMMPIAGEEFVYEMVLKCLLMPGANGFPTWKSEYAGEQMMMKIPQQFRHLFKEPAQLSEDIGEALAKWAAGGPGEKRQPVDISKLLAQYEACSDAATLRVLEEERRAIWAGASKDDKARLKTAADEASKRIDDATAANGGAESEDRADIE